MQSGVTDGADALSGMGVVRLYEQSRVERRVRNGTLPAWACEQYEAFDAKLLGERDGTAFPCHFGVEAQENGGSLYTFVPRLGPGGDGSDSDSTGAHENAGVAAFGEEALDAFADVLEAYLATHRMHGSRTSLVTLFEPPASDAEWGESEYRDVFWGILQALHDADDAAWPERIPSDPAHPQFEFSFAGEPMFVTGAAPFYDERASRYNPNGLEITFQPRSVFEGITGDTEAGQRAREQIHERIEGYDDLGPHGHIGDWEDDDSHEWKQYLLPTGDDAFADDACPLEIDADTTTPAPGAGSPSGTSGGGS